MLRGYFISDVAKKFTFRFICVPAPLWFLFTGVFIIFMTYTLFRIFFVYKMSRGQKREQTKYFMIGHIILCIAGPMYFLLPLNVATPPLDTPLLVMYCSIIAYAIVTKQLMGIEVIIKKTLVFASLFAIVFGVFVGITLLTQELIAGGRLLGLAISSIVIILTVRPLENFLINITDKYLFQKKYDPTQLIKTFTDEVITLMDLDKLTRTTITTLVNILNLESSAVLLLNKDEDKYELKDSYGLVDNNIIFNVESGSVRYLSKMGDVLFRTENMPSEMKEDMKKLNAEIILPLILHKQMIGILALGKKKSDQVYTKEDIDILTALAKAEAIALSNARLFSEAKQNVKLAAIGALAAGINHEVCNPLNRMMSSMQIFLKSKELGLYKDKSDKELAQLSDNIMNDAMNDIRKIANITRKLSDFAKPSKEVKVEKIDISESLKDAIGVLGHEIELKKIDFIQDIKEPLFIIADRDQLQEIFFNIIRNAIEAIGEKGKIIFFAQKKNDNVVIDITDTGHGISEDKLQKIYDPFYTTKGERGGTGLGLAIVHQLVTRNKGEIYVRSQVGKGTTFTLVFPEAT